MRRYLRTASAAAMLTLGLTACDNDILNLDPKDQVSDDAVFADPNLAETFLNDIYIGMGHGLYEIMLASMTDEAHFIHNYNTEQIVQGLITDGDRGAIGDWRMDHHDWSNNYSRIRQANIFLQNIEEADFEEGWKNRMRGEAHFLRAYFYHSLLRMYGGVPIITQVYGLDDDYEVPRNSFAETVDFIVAEAEAAAALLPDVHGGGNEGRATRGAALALKSRVLLYAASDLYHRSGATAETGYAGSADRQALWRAARDAARDVIDSGMYSLYAPDPATPEEAAENYGNLFLQKTSSEAIMSRFFLVNRGDGYHPGLHNGPNGYHNWGGNTPIQNLVDDYLMADGSRFDWSNPDHAAAPYENREPRFYASILYDGAPWRERPEDMLELDPHGIIQTFRTLTLPDGSTLGGLDTRDGPIEDWNGAYSGYYIRKFIDPSVNHQFVKQEVPWVFFRYAEILLNFAEASIELGELAEATDALNQLRRRAGLPELSAGMGQEALREAYQR